MKTPPTGDPDHLLVYEPRSEGHHPTWLRFLAEDLLSGGYRLTLAVDTRAAAEKILRDSLGELHERVTLVPALDPLGRPRGGSVVRSVETTLAESRARRVFLGEFDEIASAMFRRAATGLKPPARLHGRVGGIYHRPRFMAAPWWSPNRFLKQLGFRRLLNAGWLNPLLFLDPGLHRARKAEFPRAPLCYLPNPCPLPYPGERHTARRELGIPPESWVFLFYGGGYRRKGLHLAVEAFLGLPEAVPAFLLCVGRQNPDPQTAASIDALTRQRRAVLINRYVSSAEEAASFVACDVVLLPYLNHFGISAVLTQAVAAGKPVIASDEQLLGQETREHGLGLLFPSGNVAELRARLLEAASLTPEKRAAFGGAIARYAAAHSRAAFRDALLQAMQGNAGAPVNTPPPG